MRDYRNLEVWRRSHQLVLGVFDLTESFPRQAQFGLTAQIRRSAISIPSNIAEGAGRSGRPDSARFLDIAGGSANELEYQLLLARDLGYSSGDSHQRECAEIRAMLTRLRARVLAGDRGLETGD
jgi:four helix bundle protein